MCDRSRTCRSHDTRATRGPADEGSRQPFAVEPLMRNLACRRPVRGPLAPNVDACPARATDQPDDHRGPPAATLAPPPGIGGLTTRARENPKLKIGSAGGS